MESAFLYNYGPQCTMTVDNLESSRSRFSQCELFQEDLEPLLYFLLFVEVRYGNDLLARKKGENTKYLYCLPILDIKLS
jgi:hypothetical protein